MRTVTGIGLDTAEVERIRQLMARYEDRFVLRILTEGEIRYCAAQARPAESVAARWAAKEAFIKALGASRRETIGWREVEVVRPPNGAPTLALHGRAAAMAAALGIDVWHISLTHTREMASAVVMLGKSEK